MLNKKVIAITGGAGLLGSVFVELVVKNNGIAVIADIDLIRAAEVKNKIIRDCPEASIEVVELDILSLDSINSLIETLHNKYGRIDALVNNAYPKNKNFGKTFFDINDQDFTDFLGAHLGGYFNISQQFIKYYLKQQYGNIVNMSSIQGVAAPAFETYEGTNMHSPIEYTVAKHGLIGMTKYMAKMFKKDNIRVNAISPGGILDRQPARFLQQYKNRCGTKGMLTPPDLTGVLLYLLSDASQFMNGQNLVVDDGFGL